jgi:ABC-type uncharacterized transport system auxiliary subunit
MMIMILFAAGLSCRSAGLPTKYYLIETDPAIVRSPSQHPVILGIGKIRAPSRYRDQIVYRTSAYDLGFYEYSRWAEPPDEMVRRALKNIADRSGLFRGADFSELLIEGLADLVLEGEIVAFDQLVDGAKTYAVCELTLFLIEGKSSSSLWTFTASSEIRQEKEGGFAPAMSSAVREAIEDALAALESSGVLSRLAAGKKVITDH